MSFSPNKNYITKLFEKHNSIKIKKDQMLQKVKAYFEENYQRRLCISGVFVRKNFHKSFLKFFDIIKTFTWDRYETSCNKCKKFYNTNEKSHECHFTFNKNLKFDDCYNQKEDKKLETINQSTFLSENQKKRTIFAFLIFVIFILKN